MQNFPDKYKFNNKSSYKSYRKKSCHEKTECNFTKKNNFLYINITTLKQGAWCKKSKSLVAFDKWCWQGLVSQKNTFLKMTCKNKLISASKIIQHIILFPPAETQCLRLNWFTSCLNEESNLEHFWSTFLSWAKEEFCFFRPTQNFRH